MKHDVLARAERAAPEGALIATDTSSISVDDLAAVLSRPHRSLACTGSIRPSSSLWWRSYRVPAHCRPSRRRYRLGAAAGQAPGACAPRRRRLCRQPHSVRRFPRSVRAGGVGSLQLCRLGRGGQVGSRRTLGRRGTIREPGPGRARRIPGRCGPSVPDARGRHRAGARSKCPGRSGRLGCKTGRGLYGSYDSDAIAALGRRRARVLLALEQLAHDSDADPAGEATSP